MSVNLSMDCLRSFVAVVRLGSFSRAAEHIGRTSPAVSLQMEKLENQAGVTLFKKEGRNKTLTAAGAEFFEHARAILAQNDAAVRLSKANQVSGRVRLGIIQDLAEDFFPQALGSFSDQFQNIRIEVLVDRSQVLLELLERKKLDIVIAYKRESASRSQKLKSSEMIWLGRPGKDFSETQPVPIVLVEGPCLFRNAALAALTDAGLSWEVKLTSPSLACVAAAAEAGMGFAVRTPDLLNRKKDTLSAYAALPKLPDIDLLIYWEADNSDSAISKLLEYWIQEFESYRP